MKSSIFILLFLAFFTINGQAANTENLDNKILSVAAVTFDKTESLAVNQSCNRPAISRVNQQIESSDGSFNVASINCGIPPIPPIGCRVGACVCDQYGRNCQYTFICN